MKEPENGFSGSFKSGASPLPFSGSPGPPRWPGLKYMCVCRDKEVGCRALHGGYMNGLKWAPNDRTLKILKRSLDFGMTLG